MAVHKVEICPYLHRESARQNKAHENVLNWQMRYRWIKHVLSHDKRELTFHEDKYFEEFKKLGLTTGRRFIDKYDISQGI